MESPSTPEAEPKMSADVLTIDAMAGLLAPLHESICRTERRLEELVAMSTDLHHSHNLEGLTAAQLLQDVDRSGSQTKNRNSLDRSGTPSSASGFGSRSTSGISATSKRSLKRGMSVMVRNVEYESATAKALKAASTQIRQRRAKELCLFLAEKIEDTKEPERSGYLYAFTKSQLFERTTAAVIVTNVIFVAVTSNWEVDNIGKDPPLAMQIVELSFLAYYCLELFVRLTVHRLFFFCNADHKWNIFDFVLVVLSIQDTLMFYLMNPGDSSGNLSFMRMFRLAKLAKVLRAVRAFRVFRELSAALETCRRTMLSLFWAFIMLAFALYVFALIFVQGVVSFLTFEGDIVDKDTYEITLKYFGSVDLAIVNLYMAVTGGNDWVTYYDVIHNFGVFYAALFIFFTFFFVFALFNILTGIMVEKAVVASQPDRDELILEQCRKSRKEAEEFRVLCRRLDTDHSGEISFEEFVESMQDERMVSYMATVGLEVHDVELFFKIVANAQSKDDHIEIDAFVEGCMSMKGNASGLDMQKSLYETSRLHKKVVDMEEAFTSRMAELTRFLQRAAEGFKQQVTPLDTPSPNGEKLSREATPPILPPTNERRLIL